jgi:hypothetical protein
MPEPTTPKELAAFVQARLEEACLSFVHGRLDQSTAKSLAASMSRMLQRHQVAMHPDGAPDIVVELATISRADEADKVLRFTISGSHEDLHRLGLVDEPPPSLPFSIEADR